MTNLQKVLDKVNQMRGTPRQTLRVALAEAKRLLRRGGARDVEEGKEEEEELPPQTLPARFLHERLGLSWDVTARLLQIARNLLASAGPLGFITGFGRYIRQEVPETVLLSLGGILGLLSILVPLLSSDVRLPPVGDVGEEVDTAERTQAARRRRAERAARAEAARVAAAQAERAASPTSPRGSPPPIRGSPTSPRVAPGDVIIRPVPRTSVF